MKSNLATIIKKELSRFFMDRKLLLNTVLIPGLMIYIIYTLMGSVFTSLLTTDDNYVYKISAVGMPQSIEAVLKEADIPYKEISEDDVMAKKDKITDGTEDLCVVFPDNFDSAVESYDSQSGTAAPEIQIYYNSGETASYECYQTFTSLLDAYENSMINKFDINSSDKTFDLADGSDLMSRMMFALIPMLFLTLLFSGCCAIAPDFIAGEKERGTVATLLVTPMKRSSLAFGKIISMSIMALLSGLSSFLGVMLSLPKLANMGENGNSMFDFSGLGTLEYVLLLLLVLSVVLVLVSVLSLISAQAKTVKEAGTAMGPLNIIIMVVGIAGGYMAAADTGIATSFIPLYNFAKNMTCIFAGTPDVLAITVTVVSNLVYTAVCTWGLTRMFNSERLMFSN